MSEMKQCPNCGDKGHADTWDNETDVAEWSCYNENCRVQLYEVPKSEITEETDS